jgi:hypothetical protein
MHYKSVAWEYITRSLPYNFFSSFYFLSLGLFFFFFHLCVHVFIPRLLYNYFNYLFCNKLRPQSSRMSCLNSLVHMYKSFEQSCCLSLRGRSQNVKWRDLEVEGSSKILVQSYTVSQSVRLCCWYSPFSEHKLLTRYTHKSVTTIQVMYA